MSPDKKRKTTRKKAATPGETTEEVSFEDALGRLEALVERLEEGEIPLEESLAAYSEGTRLVRLCQERLAQAETLIRELSETGGGFQLRPSALDAGDERDDGDDGGYEADTDGGNGELGL